MILALLILISLSLGALYTFETKWVTNIGIGINFNNYLTGFLFTLNFISFIPICVSLLNFNRALKRGDPENMNKCLWWTFFMVVLLNFLTFMIVFVIQNILYLSTEDTIETDLLGYIRIATIVVVSF